MMRQVRSYLKRWLVFAFVLLVITPLIPATATGNTRAAALEGKHKGFTFASFRAGAYATPASDRALEELAENGVNWVALIVTVYQENRNSTSIYHNSQASPTDDDLTHAISKAHQLGMKVLLKPHVDLANDPTHWRGQIGMEFTNADWAAWFASYRSMIYHYARLSQANGVELLCVGTELLATEARRADWLTTIAGVRASYSGPITYAGSVGPGSAINWWDQVDIIGVDVYYGLTQKMDPTLDELKAGWVYWIERLEALHQSTGKQILFTEIGYLAVDGSNRVPWNGVLGGPVDVQEQADLYEALFQTFWNRPWFAGVYWWVWETDPLQGGPCSPSFSPHDKPAEDVLRRWYGAPPRPPVQAPGLDESRVMTVYNDALGSGWTTSSWSGTFDFSATTQVAHGAKAISAATQGWGALSLHHGSFSTAPYYWLELYLYKTIDSTIRIWIPEGTNQAVPGRPVEDCRYTEGQRIKPGVWTRLRIPLKDLGAENRSIQRIIIGNWTERGATYYVDNVRLVGAAGVQTPTMTPTLSASPTPTRTRTPGPTLPPRLWLPMLRNGATR